MEDKGVYTFPKCICPKVNIIARLGYKLAYYNSTVHCFNHYTMRKPPTIKMKEAEKNLEWNKDALNIYIYIYIFTVQWNICIKKSLLMNTVPQSLLILFIIFTKLRQIFFKFFIYFTRITFFCLLFMLFVTGLSLCLRDF